MCVGAVGHDLRNQRRMQVVLCNAITRTYLTRPSAMCDHSATTMQTRQGVLFSLGLAVVLVSVATNQPPVCNFDEPGLSGAQRRRLVMQKVAPCFAKQMNKDTVDRLTGSTTLEDFRGFFSDFCPQHVNATTTCLADVGNGIAKCQLGNITRSFGLLFQMVQRLTIAGCENHGDRLAHLARGLFLLGKRPDSLIAFRRCLIKSFALLMLTLEQEDDFTSVSYIFYRAFATSRPCLEHIEHETYKAVGQWFLDEITTSMECVHPQQNTTVLCSELVVAKVHVIDMCNFQPLKQENLYEYLEDQVLSQCYHWAFNPDEYNPPDFTTNQDEMKGFYKNYICERHRQLPECLLKNSAYGESCLTREENQHFQLETQAMEDYMTRLCVEEGAFLATIMQEVYKNSSKDGHALHDCYKSVEDASNMIAAKGQTAFTKSTRFYHDFALYKTCVVEKLRATNGDLATSVEMAFSEVLGKVKCVNPEDGLVVLCESIQQH